VRWAICSINCFFAHLAGTQELVRSSGGGVALGQLVSLLIWLERRNWSGRPAAALLWASSSSLRTI
jgi:hypothetical protein